MSQFENVTIIKKANVYYDGKVTSRSILFQDGTKKTLGILMPGQYDFGTDEKEIMEILDGELLVKLPGQEVWSEIKGGQSFEVPAKSRFQMDVKKISDYCCSYIQNS
ncbi:pyrimidine/purine nucleoside phosphorylase [Leptospira noguchii]|uniref:pyrimidine/purine nucleoside phosphorylase n=1 Tax=Leptospira noguchii TaxID=28182 RepID=UPI00032843F4|nr:pyrimidine/purine nucleoside phosphorylase [Leptospira noguchii]EMS82218.1 PF06865 family protein [Leptospira noguchii str. Cascata]MCH1910524.1 pyrimidine/purine nucleoside phosphorylase [Leptospira noguchii]MCH1914859.1 pyrimidine/purine nucleoside phosphorylase [Leptospira noguchii]